MRAAARAEPGGLARPAAPGRKLSGVLRRCGGKPCACSEKERLEHALGHNAGGVPQAVHRVLATPGRPLDPAARAFGERHLAHDFSAVRIHTDATAASSAATVGAHAYTVGPHVVFGHGMYSPGTPWGRRILAHELAHAVQQGSAPAPPRLELGSPGDPAEAEAERAAASASHPLPGRPGTFGRLMRTIALAPDCTPDIAEVRGNVTRAQASAARWARAATTALGDPEGAATLLRRHFRVAATDRASVATIRSNFETILGHLETDAFTYYCGGMPGPGATGCGQEPCEATVAGRACHGELWISFCDPYPFQNFFGHRSLIDTLLHEAAHAHSAAFNHDTYEHASAYPGPSPLTNADSYSSFARDAALGRPGPLVELSLGSLMAAEPQFYIAAGVAGDVGGPALDVINLRLGARLAFMPGTRAEPTRFLVAGDIGLRINPIRERVYVDVTSGAFFGANFRDNEFMLGIANRVSAGYRGDRVDLGLDLSHFADLLGDRQLLVVGIRGGVRF